MFQSLGPFLTFNASGRILGMSERGLTQHRGCRGRCTESPPRERRDRQHDGRSRCTLRCRLGYFGLEMGSLELMLLVVVRCCLSAHTPCRMRQSGSELA